MMMQAQINTQLTGKKEDFRVIPNSIYDAGPLHHCLFVLLFRIRTKHLYKKNRY